MDSREDILKRLLNTVPDGFDKSEGSFFYDVLSSVAIELEKGYLEQSNIIDKGFAETATGIYLEKKCAEKGISRKAATKATGIVTITGGKGSKVSIGDKVASDTLTYTVTEEGMIQDNEASVKVECDEYGAVGNAPIGAVKYFPITISGLNTVTNKEAFSNGYDEESDESLRDRYYTQARTPATSGNKYHYCLWAKEVVGVGDAKVFPLADGPGTVKVVIINRDKRAANSNLLNSVVSHIERNKPIGASVSVISAIEKNIDIKVNVTLSNGYTINTIEDIFRNKLVEYMKEIAFSETYVSYAKIGTLLLNTLGVIDYESLTVNDDMVNIPLNDEQIPVLSSVSLEVM